MTITAKFMSRCGACGGTIEAGSTVNWEKGAKATHVQCPSAIASPSRASVPSTGQTNKKPADCIYCGLRLAPGTGSLWWGEDGCCNNPTHFDDGGWHVTCIARDACTARAKIARADAVKDRNEAVARQKLERSAKDTAAKVAKDSYESTRAALIAEHSLVPTVTNIDKIVKRGPMTSVATMDDGFYKCTLSTCVTELGVILVDSATGYDDYRTTFYASQ